MIRLATDVGGTFTDLIGYDEQTGRLYTAKRLTTVHDQSIGNDEVIAAAGIECGLDPEQVGFFVHGGTTVINALTERKGVKTALVTTGGFRDVLEIGRGNRPDLYNLKFKSPTPYIERDLRFEVDERIAANGAVLTPLNDADIACVGDALAAAEVDAVAILFLHSYANPAHEQACAAALAARLPGVAICCSHEVSQVWREYERSNTVALNAYVKPIISRYFDGLKARLVSRGVTCPHYAMQSNGGLASFDQAVEAPLNLVESGPAGGVAGAARIGALIDEPNVLSLDIGGTTAKCSVVIDGAPRVLSDYHLEWSRLSPGYPAQVPVIDIVEIGAGGGSIAQLDNGGRLLVGPESAGADPGPVCYGRGGTRPTVTDAKLVTGAVAADSFGDGAFTLDAEAARSAIGALGARLGLETEAAAQAIIDVAEAAMINALKLVTIQRGHDPRELTLVIAGGAGPMFAASLARELQVKRVVVPPNAGIFSAWGMLAARPRVDLRRTWFAPLTATAVGAMRELEREMRRDALQYFGRDDARGVMFRVSLEMRYRGQEHSVSVNIDDCGGEAEIEAAFHAEHERAFTFRLPGAAIEITGAHVAAELDAPIVSCPLVAPDGLGYDAALRGRREVYFGPSVGWRSCPVLTRDRLPTDTPYAGPLLVEEPTTTTLVHPGQQAVRNARDLLLVEAAAEG